MFSREFQSILVQMKDATDRTIGVVDSAGTVVASGDLTLIGKKKGRPRKVLGNTEGTTAAFEGYTYKALGETGKFDYAVFTEGRDGLAETICILASVAFNEAGVLYEDSEDKLSFIKTIITESILPGDIFVRAQELHFTPEVSRGVFVIRLTSANIQTVLELVQDTFPDSQNDYIFTAGDTDIVVVKEMPAGTNTDYLFSMAKMIHDKIETQLGYFSVVGVATPANHLRELAERYKQALTSIDIGKVFDTSKHVISYENLGIYRLIYQLPTTLCEIFLSEVFKDNQIEDLDEEALLTIDSFFENSLNVSETSRKLFIHRNTLVYRLDKINKTTGLDLREFDHAIIFKVALMVNKYLKSQESKF